MISKSLSNRFNASLKFSCMIFIVSIGWLLHVWYMRHVWYILDQYFQPCTWTTVEIKVKLGSCQTSMTGLKTVDCCLEKILVTDDAPERWKISLHKICPKLKVSIKASVYLRQKTVHLWCLIGFWIGFW